VPHPTRIHRYTYRDYLALEEASNVKHEYLDGEIYGMAGGTPTHAALAVAVSSALHQQLRGGPCRVYSSDLRVRALAGGMATYPDVTVVCGELETDPESATTVTNPRLVVEVLSDSTEDYDRGEKLDHYRSIPSMAAVVLVSHRASRIESWQRAPDGGWRLEAAGAGETLTLTALDAALEVEEVYRGVPLDDLPLDEVPADNAPP
jgi:Uma2 family endonuclease